MFTARLQTVMQQLANVTTSSKDWLLMHREECEARGATILYATHIFDGLEPWLTHLAFVSNGKLLKGAPLEILSCC